MENQGQYDFDPERFDFCIHRRKRNQAHRAKQEATSEVPKKIKTLLPKTKVSSTPDSLPGTAASSVDTPLTTSTPTTSAADGGKRFCDMRYASTLRISTVFNLCDMSFISH